MGEIGGNDFNNALLGGKPIEEVQTFVPAVVDAIGSAINVKSKMQCLFICFYGTLVRKLSFALL
jgi:hypothetical protein